MTDGEVGSGASAERGRVRAFLADRSLTQRLGASAAVAVLVVAPFGGWSRADDSDADRLKLHERLDIGPFYLTIERVRQVGELPPVLQRDDSVRYFALNLTVTNHSERAEQARLVMDSIGGEHAGIATFPGESAPDVRLYDIDDAVEVGGGEYINPGTTYHLAFVIAQEPDTDLDKMTLEIFGLHFRNDDPATLDPDEWKPDNGPLAEGHLPVEVKP